jgi:hypothetical protein
MVTVNGNSSAYDRMGELNFSDEDGTPIIILCYVQVQSIKGHDNFVLISNNNLDDIQTDINYHSSMSRHVGIVPLRRLSKQPYHYGDTHKHISLKGDSITEEQSSSVIQDDTTMLTVEETDNVASPAQTNTGNVSMRLSTSHSRATKRSRIPEDNGKKNAQIARRTRQSQEG